MTDFLEILTTTRALVAEAAMTGFNCHDGDWAERLYANQARLTEAIKSRSASGETVMKSDVERMIIDWQDECAEHPQLHNQGNVLLSRLRSIQPSVSMADFLTGMGALTDDAINTKGQTDE
jgi:hypothetical protein